VLAEGGNAVDACIAAAFVSWIAESPLTGPGAGGFMLVHRAADRSTRLLDHFVTVPGLGLRRYGGTEMESVAVAFTPESSQTFRIGGASCAVPGAVAGLNEAHRLFGSLPWPVLLEPAIELARTGVVLSRPQAYLHAILDLILRHTDEGRAIYGRNGDRLVAGDRLVMPDLAETLERLAEFGAADFYHGELARVVSGYVRQRGGEITLRDLAAYRVIRRRPVQVPFLGHEFASNPPPSTGGVLIGLGVRLIDGLGLGGPPGSAEAMAQLVEIMREQEIARGGPFSRQLYRGGLARRLYDERSLVATTRRLALRLPAVERGTTHIAAGSSSPARASISTTCSASSTSRRPGRCRGRGSASRAGWRRRSSYATGIRGSWWAARARCASAARSSRSS
jgi:gamma-glutamyltranspeptidase/glutathione hydrolase